MTARAEERWRDANQRHLMAALDEVRARLARGPVPDTAVPDDQVPNDDGMPDDPASDDAAPDATASGWLLSRPSALDELCERFALSPFERSVLLACAGMELDARFAAVCGAALGTGARGTPTFGLALATLPGAHWSALAPDAPLRHWRLVEVGTAGLTAAALRIDERVVHFLTGVDTADEQLAGFVRRVSHDPRPLVPSQQALADVIAEVWSRAASPLPVVQLCGGGEQARAVAAAAAARLGLALHVMPARVLPSAPHELDVLTRLWTRESALSRGALLLECDDARDADAARELVTLQFLENAGGPLLVAGRERQRLRHRPSVTLQVRKPTSAEQRTVWRDTLGRDGVALNGQLDQLAAHFDLGASAIQSAAAHARAADDGAALDERLWLACRAQARPQLDDLVERLTPTWAWDDLVLPEAQLRMLRDIATQVRHRATVYERWGFADQSVRGLGISALFSGPSGTGKTMAAEVLARELRLDLYRIDLSRVVSKYIGETEKNLARVFDAAEEGGAILLFDEADALFGKRTEVKDSHDRYANIEVSYLLQRMESYRGLAILTTNLKGAIDDAFQRRIRFLVTFPFPDARQRAEIWRRAMPARTPTEALDVDKLARLSVAGGNIRNIALHAAFFAAEFDAAVGMAHMLRAARAEFARLEKPLGEAELRGWV